jgi:hypothetical protein
MRLAPALVAISMLLSTVAGAADDPLPSWNAR